jgi:lipid-A-disaccharide synthase
MLSSAQPDRPLRLLISAGEASGEMYGAALLESLRSATNVDCFGVGGELMRRAGCDTVVDANRIAVVGLVEVLRHLPGLYGEFHKLLREVDRRRPDVAVLVDFPDWNFRLAKQLRRRGIPVVYYISPQLWAWRKHRIKLVQRYVTEMLVIFPFEQDFYASHGVEAEFVGHPLADISPPACTARPHQIALLPGSRRKELKLNLPTMLRAAARLGTGYSFALPVASTLSRDWVREQIAAEAPRIEAEKLHLPGIDLTTDARLTLAQSRAAIVASGTATVETALIGTPFVMVYRVSPLTYAIGKRLVNVPFYGMVNLIAGRLVVPELIQHDFTPEKVAQELGKLIANGQRRSQMLNDLAEVRQKLHGNATGRASDNAARAVLEILGARVQETGKRH